MTNLLIVMLFEWLFCLSNLLINPRKLAYDKGFQREIRCKKFDNRVYQSWAKRTFQVRSDFGYILSCELIEQPDCPSSEGKEFKIAILCHGIGCAKYESIKYAQMFMKLGFHVIIYDHRNHGQSGKAFTSMGYFEKYDLRKIIDWCYKRFGPGCQIITHGESMGAATVLMHLEIDNRVKVAIADCAYSDLKLLLRHQLKQYYHLPRSLIYVESCIAYLRAGFWFYKVSPILAVLRTNTPVLFIHGKRDNFVPTVMSKQMYECKKKNKGIYLVAKARHAESYYINPKGYEERVENFINRYL